MATFNPAALLGNIINAEHPSDKRTDTDWDSDLDEIPANTYIQRRQASAAKARENMNERTPLLGASPPPPAYANATRNDANTSRSGSPAQQRDGSSAAEPRLFHSDRPQSMNNHPADPESGKNSKPRRRYFSLRILIVLGLVLLISIAVLSVMGVKHASNGGQDNGNGDSDGGSDDGRKSKIPSLPHVTDPDDSRRSSCHLQDFTESQWFDFASPHAFYLIELMRKPTHISGGIGGQVRVRGAQNDQTAAIVVGIRYATSGVQMSQLNVKAEPESLRLEVPQLTQTASYSCVDIDVTMFVRADVALEHLVLATDTLNIKVDSDLFANSSDIDSDRQDAFYISNSTYFATTSGDVSVAYWSSRETRVELISGHITGRFALRDVLFIKTQSGSIDVSVDPKPVDLDHPRPAQFSAISTSGSIRTCFPTSGTAAEIPERDYHSRVETSSGSIRGEFILGAEAFFRTISGSIRAEVLPYAADLASSFTTETQGGQIQVNLLAPYKDPRTAIKSLRSFHHSTSGSLRMQYPQQWEGAIEGLSVSGSVRFEGRDVRENRSWRGPVGTHVVAEKGNGKSRLEMKTTSGNILAVVGETN